MAKTWCIQCGKNGRALEAAGVDGESDPACTAHMARNERVTNMEITKKCPGYKRECGRELKPKNSSGLCTACYARRNYHENRPPSAKRADLKSAKLNRHSENTATFTLTETRINEMSAGLPFATKKTILQTYLEQAD